MDFLSLIDGDGRGAVLTLCAVVSAVSDATEDTDEPLPAAALLFLGSSFSSGIIITGLSLDKIDPFSRGGGDSGLEEKREKSSHVSIDANLGRGKSMAVDSSPSDRQFEDVFDNLRGGTLAAETAELTGLSFLTNKLDAYAGGFSTSKAPTSPSTSS